MEKLAAVLKETASRPTHVQELVRTLPLVTGYCDAAAEEAGNCIFTTFANANPSVTITNSDLELAAEILH
eukprot:13918551-Ditylum_brightwellii.AAC.1